MSVDKVSIIYSLNDHVLEALCNTLEKKCSGVAAAARELKTAGRLSSSLCNTLVKFDWTYNFMRHLTSQHAAEFYNEVLAEVNAPRSTVVRVDGSMIAGKEDDAVSIDTVYPSSIGDIYDASWTDGPQPARDDEPHSSAVPSPRHSSPSHAILTPRVDHGVGSKSRRKKRIWRPIGPSIDTPAPEVHDSSQRSVPASSTRGIARPHHRALVRRGVGAVGHFDVPSVLADNNQSWRCPCGFKNVGVNNRCGGHGPLGCNRSRRLLDSSCDRRQRSRSPHTSYDADIHERVITQAVDQLNQGLTRVHVSGIPGPVIRLILRSRPDLFDISDRISARGVRAYNVSLVKQELPDGSPVGSYHRSINPFRDGRV